MANTRRPPADPYLGPGSEDAHGLEVDGYGYGEDGYGEDLEAKEAARTQRLHDFGMSLAKTRAEAIAGRQQSGVEDMWAEDEEFYEGIDDANRGEDGKYTWRQKPPRQVMAKTDADAQTRRRSTVFPNITGPFCDAAAARIADMLLPSDDAAFKIKPTPVPTLSAIAKGKFPAMVTKNIAAAYPADPAGAQNAIVQAQAQAKAKIDEANERANKAQKRLEDWDVENQYHAQMRMVIDDAARIGTGVVKGPTPLKRKLVLWRAGALEIVEDFSTPGAKFVDPWNLFPDPACGENIHNGSYLWERDYLSVKQLRDLQGQDGYLDDQITACIEEGPMHVTGTFKETPDPVTDPSLKNKFEAWYGYCTAEREDLEAAGCDCEDLDDPHLPVLVTLVNSRVIRCSLNPLDTGEFPYDVFVWRRRAGYWTGIGVARQIRTPQKIVVGATRALMNNAGLACGPMLVFRQGVVEPADGVAGIAPFKVYYIAEDADEMVDATKAVGQIKVDMLVNEMMAIIQLGMQLAETVTNMPMILQGQMGPSVPDTLGGQQMFMQNASTVLRRLAKLYDDRITEPRVRRFYSWLLQYGEDDDEKGDMTIDARGSSALVERALQAQQIWQWGNLVLDPRFGKDPKKWFDEAIRAQRFDPKNFEYDDDEWKKVVENMAQGPQDPRLAVAQLKAETEGKIEQLRMAFEERENDKDRQLDLLLKGMEAELDTMKLRGSRDINWDSLKTRLAETFAKLRTQTSLAHMKPTPRVTAPPTEPPQRAPAGQAYQQ